MNGEFKTGDVVRLGKEDQSMTVEGTNPTINMVQVVWLSRDGVLQREAFKSELLRKEE